MKARHVLYQSFLEFTIVSYINTSVDIGISRSVPYRDEEQLDDVLKMLLKNIHQTKETDVKGNEQEYSAKLKRIEIMQTIFYAFDDAYSETRFSLTWLFACLNEVYEFEAAHKMKLIIVKWIWESLDNLNKSSSELYKIPAQVMAQLISLKFLSVKSSFADTHSNSLIRVSPVPVLIASSVSGL
jgi:hypothetical protein